MITFEFTDFELWVDQGLNGTQPFTRHTDGCLDTYLIGNFTADRDLDWVAEHVVYRDGLTFIVGPAGSGKTFLALDMAAHLASPVSDWHGWTIRTEPQRVAYIINESRQGFYHRAMMSVYANSLPREIVNQHLLIIPHTLSLFTSPETVGSDMDRLNRTLQAFKPDLVIMDIFARMTRGGNENQQEDMQKAIGQIEDIKKTHNSPIVCLHHTNKQGEIRGSTILTDYPDHVLLLKPDGEPDEPERTIKIGWLKYRGPNQPQDKQLTLIKKHPSAYLTEKYVHLEKDPNLQKAINRIKHQPTTRQNLADIWPNKATRNRKIKLLKEQGWVTEQNQLLTYKKLTIL